MNLKKILIVSSFFFVGCFHYYISPAPKYISHNELKNIVLSNKKFYACSSFLKTYNSEKSAYSNLGHEAFYDAMTIYDFSFMDYDKKTSAKGESYEEQFYFNSIQANLLLEFDTRLFNVNAKEIFSFINMSELELKSSNNLQHIKDIYRECFSKYIYGNKKNKDYVYNTPHIDNDIDIDGIELTFKNSILEFYFNSIKTINGKEYKEKIQLYSVPYENNKKNGLAVIYFYDGNVSAEINYIDGVSNGESKRYYKNGKLKNAIYYDNGKLHGTFYSYYKNGDIRSEINFINDEIQGYYKEYYKNGNIRKQILFKDGNIAENIKHYYESGNILYDIPIKDNKRYGTQKDYYESGELYREHNFIHNDGFYKRLQTSKEYSKSGKLLFDVVYDKKTDNHIMRFYYESGNIKKTYAVSAYDLSKSAHISYKLGTTHEYAENGTLLR